MNLSDVVSTADVIKSRDCLDRFGKTPLGVFAQEKGVFSNKDNYERRERLVREWATNKYGEQYVEGVYRAVNGLKRTRNNSSFVTGYTHGKRLMELLD